MYTKSQAAFILTCQRLFESCSGKMYFWTITSVKVMHDWQYPIVWRRMSRSLQNLGLVFGVRVLEPHREHGLHYHLLINRRLSVHIMRRLANKAGFGFKGQFPRVHVCVADSGVSFYLAKYLAKGGKLWPGLHRWGTIGGYQQTKVHSIEIDSVTMRAFRVVRGTMKWRYHECAGLWAECSYHGQIILDRQDEICNDGAVIPEERLLTLRSVTHRYTEFNRKLRGGGRVYQLNNQTYEKHDKSRLDEADVRSGIDCADAFFCQRTVDRGPG
jgi:hypothetical protein